MNRKAREQAKMAAMKEQELRQFKKAEKNALLLRSSEIDRIKADCEHRLRSVIEQHEYEVKRLKDVISLQERRIELFDMTAKERVNIIDSLRRQLVMLTATNDGLTNDNANLRTILSAWKRQESFEEDFPKPIKQYDGIRKLDLDD